MLVSENLEEDLLPKLQKTKKDQKKAEAAEKQAKVAAEAEKR